MNKVRSFTSICFGIFCLLSFVAATQASGAKLRGQARIDSLLQVLPKETADTQKVKILSLLSFDYSSMDPEKGIKFGNEAVALAEKINWEKGIASAHYYRGANYLYTARLPEALDDYLKGLPFFERTLDSAKMAGTYSNVGGVYAYQGKKEKALEYFLKALKINRVMSPGSNFESANLGNIAIIYHERDDYETALKYSLAALKICEDHNYIDMLPNAIVSAAAIYSEMKQYKKAYEFANRALGIAREEQDMTVCVSSLALKGFSIMNMINDGEQENLSAILGDKKSQALAIARSYIDSSITLAKEVDDLQQQAEGYKMLSELEELNGNADSALKYHRLYKTTADSILNVDVKEQMLQSSMQYEFDKKEAETKAEQEKKDIRQRNIRNSIIAGLIGALIFGIVVYRQRNKIAKEKQRSEELLLNILPGEVAEELKAKGSADAKQFEEITVMFTDFKGFTQIAEKMSPGELVAEIDVCFKAFDGIITRNGLEKIKTIGDSYMCAGGLPVPTADHAEKVVKAALEIQEFMEQHQQERIGQGKARFEARIGIHTGPVVAGIVGVKKFAYDIWGDTVNIASRMESSGEAGKVNISGSTYSLVKDKFMCQYRGKVEAKNKGEIDMYFVAKG